MSHLYYQFSQVISPEFVLVVAVLIAINVWHFRSDRKQQYLDRDVKERDLEIRLLDADIRALGVDATRVRAQQSPLPEVVQTFTSIRQRLHKEHVARMAAKYGVPAVDVQTIPPASAPVSGVAVPAVPALAPAIAGADAVPDDEAIPVAETSSVAPLELVIINLNKTWRIVIGSYPELDRRFTTLEGKGESYEIKTYPASEDEETIINDSLSLGQARMQEIEQERRQRQVKRGHSRAA